MDQYAGRLLADRYRLPRPPAEAFELAESRAFDTASGQEVLVRQVPLPEVIDPDAPPSPAGAWDEPAGAAAWSRATRTPEDPVVRRAVEAAVAAAALPDHPRLDQVFDVFVQGDALWIVSELVPARPLAALLAEQRLGPYRAAEVAADLLAALRVVHAHGWTHRNLTARTVLICDDGRALLTGLATAAAEEVLCGYDPLPAGPGVPPEAGPEQPAPRSRDALPPAGAGGTPGGLPGPRGALGPVPLPPVPGVVGPAAADGPAGARNIWRDAAPGPAGTGVDGVSGGSAQAVPDGGYGVRPGEVWDASVPGGSGDAAVPGAGPGPEQGSGGLPAPLPPGGAGPGGEGPASPGQGLVARMREQGGVPAPRAGAAGFPAAWDFEGGEPRLPGPSPSAVEQAGRRGAIAAYRAGARAGADAAERGRATGPGRDRAAGTAGPAPAPGPHDQGGTGLQPGEGGHGPHAARDSSGVVSGPAGPRPVSAPGGADTPTAGLPAVRRGAGPTELPGVPRASRPVPTGWEAAGPEPAPAPGTSRRYRGPDSARAAERARQARMTTVGPVTERWAPEQAGPVHDHWRLAPPVGPPADLWALGALLFRAVQGHPPYPEHDVVELTHAVCAEQPAFAEECGALRPVVESLLRQDPTERPRAEELRGWLRSIIRSAPEPDVGRRTVTAPPMLEPGRPADPRKLPVVRRRGELVSRRRPKEHGNPRRLGRALLVLVLLGVAAGLAYAVFLMPRDGGDAGPEGRDGTAPGAVSPEPGTSDPPDPSVDGDATTPPPADAPATAPEGYRLVDDAAGFGIAVPDGWQREEGPGAGQVRFTGEGLSLTVVPGRDAAADVGDSPMAYQLDSEPELQDYRDSAWKTSGLLRSTTVGNVNMAEGSFTWDADGGRRLARNRAMLVDGAYHLVLVGGPEESAARINEVFDAIEATYRVSPG